MQVTDVAPGIYWADIPEAGLRILCGCPADAVKHLMKKGFITRVERGGAVFESGPNAILLSDVALQGGEFCNLAEFPVLQMLYRQGMLLPGHPNNTGQRPLLLGLEEQLRAQLAYIHRGNYGLCSEEELRETGLDAETARHWMRLKLRFAFGAIQPPGDLLETRIIDDRPLDLGGGISLRRIDMNVFEFRSAKSSAIVDLNLDPATRYAPPFPLSHHNLRRDYFAVVHSGAGDGWDVNRPTMSSILMFQGRIYLIDAGPNLEALLRALGIGIQEVDGLFHTHCHDDHFAGLTTLVRADHKVRYFATPAVRASVAKKLAALIGIEESAFEDYFDVHDLPWNRWSDIDGLEVMPVFSPHPVETSVFRFRTPWEQGYKSYTHLADIVSFRVLDQMVTEDESAPGITARAAQRVKTDYLEPADIKKLDIGGGLIHGQAEDFADDLSGKIILAHTSLALTDAQREIGSGAPFGTVDVLIPAYQDYPLRFAYQHLRAYFPGVADHQLRILLNHPVQHYNPETILMREGQPCGFVFVILSGMVEALATSRDHAAILSAGAMVGESCVLASTRATETFRAIGFVRALALPGDLYRRFVAHNGLHQRIERMSDLRGFFNQTWLLGENLSEVAENRIAGHAYELNFSDGEAIAVHGQDRLLMVRNGAIARNLRGDEMERIEEGDFIGAGEVLYGNQPLCRYVAAGDTRTLVIPGSILRDIPVTRLKLFEAYQRRLAAILAPRGEGPAFPWLPDYALGIAAMDRQHQGLFTLGSTLLERIRTGDDAVEVAARLDELAAHARRHFADEEQLLATIGYPDVEEHRRLHAGLLADIEALAEHCRSEGGIEPGEFRRFFQSWLLTHIFKEDNRYARFLAEQGHIAV